MSLFKADAIIQSFQTENPRLYDALRQLSLEIRTILSNDVIGPIIVDSQNVFNIIGFKKDIRFNTIELTDRFDRIQLGGLDGALANGKLQVDEITNDHLPHEVLTIKRERPDTDLPNAGFGADLSFRLQGFTVNSEPEAGRIRLIWEQKQLDDVGSRDSELSFWNMLNGVLTQRLTITAAGTVIFDPSIYPAGRFLITGTSGAITTDANLLYDSANDIVTFMSGQSSTANPNLIIDNSSTGDSYIRFISTANQSFALGMDASGGQEFKLAYANAGAAAPGNTDVFSIDTSGRMGYGASSPSTNVKFQIFKDGTTSENIVLVVARTDANTTPTLQLNQTSTGDVNIQWVLGGGNSFAAGIDNSNGDVFKISYGSAANATLGVNDRLLIDLSGRFVINGSTVTSGRMVQINPVESGSGIWIEGAFTNLKITLNNTTASTGRNWDIDSSSGGSFVIRNNSVGNQFIINSLGSTIIGLQAALATNATEGFLYIPSCAGTPTGVPTAVTGKIPLVYDSTNHVLYARSGGAWRAH